MLVDTRHVLCNNSHCLSRLIKKRKEESQACFQMKSPFSRRLVSVQILYGIEVRFSRRGFYNLPIPVWHWVASAQLHSTYSYVLEYLTVIQDLVQNRNVTSCHSECRFERRNTSKRNWQADTTWTSNLSKKGNLPRSSLDWVILLSTQDGKPHCGRRAAIAAKS